MPKMFHSFGSTCVCVLYLVGTTNIADNFHSGDTCSKQPFIFHQDMLIESVVCENNICLHILACPFLINFD